MTANQLTLWYLIASICFILALKGLSHPETARRGNYFGMAGMTIAVLTTIAVVAGWISSSSRCSSAARSARWSRDACR
jgi:NAD/NADP transhydrogenase beta subunit